MSGMTFMFFCLIAIGGLGFASSTQSQMAVGILLVVSTLCNMITIGTRNVMTFTSSVRLICVPPVFTQ